MGYTQFQRRTWPLLLRGARIRRGRLCTLVVLLDGCLAFAAAPNATGSQAAPTAIKGESRIQELLEVLPQAPQRLAPLRVHLPDATLTETDHFALLSQRAEDEARELGRHLEAVYVANVRFFSELELPLKRPGAKLIVLLPREAAAAATLRRSAQRRGDEVLGWYDPEADYSVFFELDTLPAVQAAREAEAQNRLARLFSGGRRTLAERERALALRIMQHEAAHQIHYSFGLFEPGAAAPAWLVEGLAQMFELPFVERDASLPLSTNLARLVEYMTLQRDDGVSAERLRALLVGQRAELSPADYSLSWAVVNCLYKRRREEFGEYLREMKTAEAASQASGEAPAADRLKPFEAVFGAVDAAFADEVDSYARELYRRAARRAPAAERSGDSAPRPR